MDVETLFEDKLDDEELPSDDEDRGEQDNTVPITLEPPKPKRVARNPRPRLENTLQGPRGIHTIEDYFQGVKYKGKGYEKNDLDEMLRRLQHWGHRMYPTYKFDDVLTNIERVSRKKPLQIYMSRYRLGLLEQQQVRPQGERELADGELEGDEAAAVVDEPFDEFDALLSEQIAISRLVPRTPAPVRHGDTGSYTPMSSTSTLAPSSFNRGTAAMSTPYTATKAPLQHTPFWDESELAQPLPQTPAPRLNAEQVARIAENRRLAQERLRAKQLAQQQVQVAE